MRTTAKRYDLIIWDWNGTLLDDARLCVEIMNGPLVRRGLPMLTLERYCQILEFPIINYYRALGFDFSVEPFEAVATEFIEEYYRRWRECGLFPGARQVLSVLAASGCRQALLSAAPRAYLEEAMDFYGLTEYFDEVSGLDDHYANGKIENGRRLLARTGMAPSSTLMVGDTEHDREVAVELRIDYALVPGFHCARERLEACGGMLLSSLSEVLSLVGVAA